MLLLSAIVLTPTIGIAAILPSHELNNFQPFELNQNLVNQQSSTFKPDNALKSIRSEKQILLAGGKVCNPRVEVCED